MSTEDEVSLGTDTIGSRSVRSVRVDYRDLDGFESSIYTYKDKGGKENDAESVRCALALFKSSHHYQDCEILNIYIVRMTDKAGNDEIIKTIGRSLIEGFKRWQKQRQSKLAAQKNGQSKT